MDKQMLKEIKKARLDVEANDEREKKIHEKGLELRARLKRLENEAIMVEVNNSDMPAELMSQLIELYNTGELKKFITSNQINKEDGNE